MQVRNYYKMPRNILLHTIHQMRCWLVNNPAHPEREKVWFALEVACCARDLEKDEFVSLVIDCFS